MQICKNKIKNDYHSLFSCTLIFYFYASWANRVSKKSSRILYTIRAHFIHCWNAILYIFGAHLYLMLEHISIHSHVHIYIWICRQMWSLTLFSYAHLSYGHHRQPVKWNTRQHARPCVLNFLCFFMTVCLCDLNTNCGIHPISRVRVVGGDYFG